MSFNSYTSIMNIKNIMGISTIAAVLMTLGCVLLILGTIPVENHIEGNTLTIKYIIGKKEIDLTEAKFLPVPEEAKHNLIRTGGTSIGKIRSGNFMNSKTRTKFKFYLTGKGQQVYFEIGDKKYLVDDVSVPE